VIALYLDSSALLRIVFDQPGPRAPLSRADVAASSELVEVEIARTLDRARLAGLIDDATVAERGGDAQRLLRKLTLFPVAAEMIQKAKASVPIQISVLDSLHVATAELVADEVGPLQFWTHVTAQAALAHLRGLSVHGVRGRAAIS
jgi:hypothetical protein